MTSLIYTVTVLVKTTEIDDQCTVTALVTTTEIDNQTAAYCNDIGDNGTYRRPAYHTL